jgi:hypothetical protein
MLFLTSASLNAQNRSRMTVFVPMPTGGTQSQRSYFQENFKMELIGANYPAVETRAESTYTLILNIQENPDFDRRLPVDDSENTRYLLFIKLERSTDNAEIVNFSFPFSDIEAMSDWNLFLLYQAMANAYMPDEEGEEPLPDNTPLRNWDMNRWRNQWVYLNMASGMDLGLYLRTEDDRIQTGSFLPALFVGVEWHCLDFFSLELDPIKARAMDSGNNYVITLAAAAMVKMVIKYSTVMLEAYSGVEYALSLGDVAAPPLSMISGVQLGFRGDTKMAWVVDLGVTRNLLGVFEAGNGASYNPLRIHLMGGIKLGFRDRKKPEDM